MSKEELQRQIDELTYDLKNMDSQDNRYGRVWDERVELKSQLQELESAL
jgi:hypothetical protein